LLVDVPGPGLVNVRSAWHGAVVRHEVPAYPLPGPSDPGNGCIDPPGRPECATLPLHGRVNNKNASTKTKASPQESIKKKAYKTDTSKVGRLIVTWTQWPRTFVPRRAVRFPFPAHGYRLGW
jgi:hypothetical protein